jgi:hypothetical protein
LLSETDAGLIKPIVKAFTELFKSSHSLRDYGIETIIENVATPRPISEEVAGPPELFRSDRPLERALPRQ